HNLSDFLDNSPSLKRYKDKKASELISPGRLREQRMIETSSDNCIPPLIPIDEHQAQSKQKGNISPLKANLKSALTPVRQSPRLHSGQQRPLPDPK
ncbi:unnamed protein product, partial [Lymnaea stagnalis]